MAGIDRCEHQVWRSTCKKKDCLYIKQATVRHLRRFILTLLILVLWPPGMAQQSEAAKRGETDDDGHLTAADVNDVIHRYKQGKPAAQVSVWAQWSRWASRPASPQFREAVIRHFPAAWPSRRNRNAKVDAKLKPLLRPLLSLYGRDYTIFLMDTPNPALLIDSGAVLVMTTGFLSRLKNDDELLGFVTHEVAHAQFAERGVAAKELYAGLVARKETASSGAREALRELSRIEIECDAVATRTLSVMGMDATQFVKSVARINQEFPGETGRGAEIGVNWHPPTSTRLQVVEALAGGEARRRKLRASKLLQGVQMVLTRQSKQE